MKMRILLSIVLAGLLFISSSPAWAQLGGVTPPVEPAPVSTPAEPTVVTPPADTVTTPTEPVTQIVTPPADTTAPVISGVANLSLAEHDATIVWTTDELAVSTLEYGTSASYGQQATLGVSALLAHTAVLTGLSSGTTYYYCIHAADLAGNAANSCGHTFTTAAQTVVLDTTPPDVTLVTVSPVTATGATITFTTSEVGNARVEYGTTAGYGQSTPLDTDLALSHSVTLSGLTPNTLYHYRIITSDEIGNENITPDETFTTTTLGAQANVGSADTTPPVISGVGTVTLGLTDATIVWETNELSISTLEYGTTPNYGSHATLPLSALLAHSATLTGLAASTTYYYCIHATDIAGNSTTSCPHSFTTQATSSGGYEAMPNVPVTPPLQPVEPPQLPQTPTPEVPGSGGQLATVTITAVEASTVSQTEVTITWHTDVPADSQVFYGDSENLGSASELSLTLTTSHSVTLSGLTPNTNYVFRVQSKPVGALTATTPGYYEFTTLSHEVPIVAPANIIAVSASGITATSATITWLTDKAATAHVEYGISPGYGVVSTSNLTLATSHAITLTDLEPATAYHFRVRSVDEAENETFSEDYTFTTAVAQSGSSGGSSALSTPAAITGLSVGGYDNASVELVWHTESANADVAALYDIRYSTSPITAASFENASPAQATPIYYGDVSPQGTTRAYIVAGLEPNTMYYFALTSKHEASAYSDISNVVSITTNNTSVDTGAGEATPGVGSSAVGGGSSAGGGALGGSVSTPYGDGSGGTSSGSFEPTMVKAEPVDGQIVFSWRNPGEQNFVRTVIVRKVGGYPSSPADGTTIYEGRGATYADTVLTNGVTYFYALYSYNHSKIYSKGLLVSLAPKADIRQVQFNEGGTLTTVGPVFHFVRSWKRGDKNIEIEHLQELLVADRDSYPEQYITGYFGALTEAALRRFQKKHGLPQTGIVDAATQKELNTVSQSETRLNIPTDLVVFTTDLKFGDRGEAVKDLQQYLIYEGSYAEAIISGYFSTYTWKAVRAFQAKYTISPVSGYVGYKTRHKMQQLVGL